jgi:hypothetical protein
LLFLIWFNVYRYAEEGQFGRRLRQARSGDRRAAVTKLLRVVGLYI